MSLARQTLWGMLPLLTVSVINLASVPLFYRYLGPENYALWMYVLTLSGVFAFMDFGLGAAVGRYIGIALGQGDQGAIREYWGTANAIAIPVLAVMMLVFVGVGMVWGSQWFAVAPAKLQQLRYAFAAGGLGLFFSFYGQFWLTLSSVYQDFRLLGILRTVFAIVQVIPAIWIAYLTANPVLLILWSALVAMLQIWIFAWHARKHYQLGLNLNFARLSRFQEMRAYTAKTFAILLVHSFLGSVDRMLVGRLAPPLDFSRYAISSNVGLRIQGLAASIVGPVFSSTSLAIGRNEAQSIGAVYNQSFSLLWPWFTLAAVWATTWHGLLLRLWLGESLGNAVGPLFVPILVACCINGMGTISNAQLGPLNRLGWSLGFNVATVLLLTVSVYVGWRFGGIIGVAWAYLFSRIISILQDLCVIRWVGGGGWLAPETWWMLLGQLAVAGLFYLACKASPATAAIQTILAGLHLLIVAGWLLWRSGWFKNRSKLIFGASLR